MQDLVRTYNANSELISKSIINSLNKIDLQNIDEDIHKLLFTTFSCLELIYTSDDKYVQTSPNIYIDRLEEHHRGLERGYLVNRAKLQKRYCVSEPYISSATGSVCITVIYAIEGGYIFLDFQLRKLLERFNLIEKNDTFKRINRISYAVMGMGLLFFGGFVVLHGFYTFMGYLFESKPLTLDAVFKPIIALTLGLAVYDLGKTIIEQEVLPRTQHVGETFNTKTLMNFSASIIIALLIEALLVVFKISIHDYKDMPYAATLIAALAFLMFVFTLFIYLVRRGEKENKGCSVQ